MKGNQKSEQDAGDLQSFLGRVDIYRVRRKDSCGASMYGGIFFLMGDCEMIDSRIVRSTFNTYDPTFIESEVPLQ